MNLPVSICKRATIGPPANRRSNGPRSYAGWLIFQTSWLILFQTAVDSKMCMLFLYLNDNKHECPYRLVVANNRDEYWDRPTATAEFRGDNQQWIGGLLLLI